MGSKILQRAACKLEWQDALERQAALLIQNNWRTKKENRGESYGHVGSSSLSQFSAFRNRRVIESVTVEAPAHLGEACLWEPLEEWETKEPPTYKYAARCETQVEDIVVERSLLLQVIRSYSPWLQERFESFRNTVLDGMDSYRSKEESSSKADEPSLWTDGDTAIHAEEGCLTGAHSEALQRSSNPSASTSHGWQRVSAASPSARNFILQHGHRNDGSVGAWATHGRHQQGDLHGIFHPGGAEGRGRASSLQTPLLSSAGR